MNQLCASAFEAPRDLRRIAAIDGRLAHLTAQQAHDLTAFKIDRGNYGKALEQLLQDSVPLVESTPASRGSIWVAESIARAKALNVASTI